MFHFHAIYNVHAKFQLNRTGTWVKYKKMNFREKWEHIGIKTNFGNLLG